MIWLFVRLWRWMSMPETVRTCYVWCPSCRHDLNGDDSSFLYEDGLGGVEYCCANCGRRSLWFFGAPVPLLIR